MINYLLPEDVSPQMDFLRELYNHSQLMGSLIHKAEQLFGYCEFAKAIQEQREELAFLQFLGSIQALYKEEYDQLRRIRLGECIEDRCINHLAKR